MQEVRSSSLRSPTILTSCKHNDLREVSFSASSAGNGFGKRIANERPVLPIGIVFWSTMMMCTRHNTKLALIARRYILFTMAFDETTSMYYIWPSIKASDIAKYLAIPARRIQHYVDLDIVRVQEKQPGTGNSRMFTPANVMQIVLLDRLESIGITPKRMARFAQRLSEAVDGFVAKKGDPKFRYLHVDASRGELPLVTWPAKGKAEHWATLCIDLVELQRDFDALFKKHWLSDVDLGDNARFVDL